jgi:acyl carrier protein
MTQEASQVASRTTPDLQSLSEQQATERFLAILSEVIGVEKIDSGEHFLDAGGDSLSTAIIIDWIGQEFDTEPEFDWFFDSPTISDLARKWWVKLQESAHAADPAVEPGG